jgi:hypothetical protein
MFVLNFVERGVMVRQRAFIHERVVVGIGGDHGSDLRSDQPRASEEGKTISHKALTSRLTRAKRNFWGAHASGVLVSAFRRNNLLKVRRRRMRRPARYKRALPQNCA